MNLHALKVFYYVARNGNVTKASEELRISQPAVTQHVRNLEKELGIKLVKPEGRGISLTYAGNELYSLSGKLFAVEHEIEIRMNDIAVGKLGELTISATYLPATILLPKYIAMFKAKNEDVKINVVTGNSKEAFALLNSHKADVAIIGGGWELPNIHWEHLFDDELWFVVPPHHPLANREVSLHEMMEETFVIREDGSSTRERFLSMCRTFNVRQPKIGMQFNGLYETIKAVSAGYGANLISAMVVREFVDRGEVARVFVQNIDLRRPIAMCTVENNLLSPVAREFVQLIRDKLRVE
ncbi:LysR family transcriptional regulator [Paenibacillus sp. NEAU-GSW1]|uniref:LysR family transcriptional regulator n=1 Tax=Paenibacillus sp. NEAU-GSW1 TaxID=2682486 RepID=UPI0012E2F15B|nr:LysR family transcriptional regulator [Paenibacillus sp. NEAU-GSW1]MUT64732.1 LysR family transcriptional regulator [Paenibacillus sp. NEAU-GSW1]